MADNVFRFVPIVLNLLLPIAGSSKEGDEMWRAEVPGRTAPPALGIDGRIHTVGRDAVFAFEPDGRKAWETPLEGSSDLAQVSVAPSGLVYCLSTRIAPGPGESTLSVIDSEGRLMWRKSESGVFVGNFAILGDETLIFGIRTKSDPSRNSTKLAAVARSGTKLWERTFANHNQTVVSIGPDDTIYGSGPNGLLSAMRPKDGSTLWVLPEFVPIFAPIIDRAGIGFCFGRLAERETLVAFHPDGTVLWLLNDPGWTPVLGFDGTVFTSRNYSGKVSFVAIDPSGRILTEQAPKVNASEVRGVFPVAVAADGTVYARAQSFLGQSFLAMDVNGSTRWFVNAPSSQTPSPAIARDGTVYLNVDSQLVAFKGGCGLPNSAWPMEGGGPDRAYRTRPDSPVAPCLTGLRWLHDRGFQLTVVGEAGKSYILESSADLFTWSRATNVMHHSATTHITDLEATNSTRRFYRAKMSQD